MAYLLLVAGIVAVVGAALCISLAHVQPAAWRRVDQVLDRPGSPRVRRLAGIDPNRRGVYPVRVSQAVVFGLIGLVLILGAAVRLSA